MSNFAKETEEISRALLGLIGELNDEPQEGWTADRVDLLAKRAGAVSGLVTSYAAVTAMKLNVAKVADGLCGDYDGLLGIENKEGEPRKGRALLMRREA